MFDIFYNFSGLNKSLFIFINQATNFSILPYILQVLSLMFNISNFALCYLFTSLYFYKKIKKFKVKFWPIYNEMVKIGITYAFFGLSFAFLKFFTNLPRPFCSLPQESFETIADTTLERCLSSFPSSHTGLSLLVTYFLWKYLTKLQKIFAMIIVLSVALSRLTLAMHYPADILYSTLVLMIVILIGNLVFSIFKNNLIKKVGELLLRFNSSRL